MVPLHTLWLPVLLSAVIVFIASSLMHMVLRYHNSDFRKLPAEDQVRAALGPLNLPPGDYIVPHGGGMEAMKDPAFLEKWRQGPALMMTVWPNRLPNMGRSLVLWFVYCLVVGVFAGYIAGRALGPGAHYLAVFRFAGATAFIGYTVALWQQCIWYGRSVATILKQTIDGLIYAFLTAGTFGWLWPR
jgi:hypothetical protein